MSIGHTQILCVRSHSSKTQNETYGTIFMLGLVNLCLKIILVKLKITENIYFYLFSQCLKCR